MSSELDPNVRDNLRDPPPDYASVKYAAAVLLVAGALVAAAIAGVFNGDNQTAQNAEQPPATSQAADATDASKQPDAAPEPDAAATGASTGEAGSQAAPPAAETPPAATPAPEAPAAQPEQPQPEQPQPTQQQ